MTMKVAITGASGLIGRALCEHLREQGHTVFRLVRSNRDLSPDTIYWNPELREIEAGPLAGMDAVVHLAGETVDGRWNISKKRRIRESRVEATRFLAEALVNLPKPPKALICASAIGYYGSQRTEDLTEESPAGEGFLSEVVRGWEAAVEPLRKSATSSPDGAGVRLVHLRIGVVLDPEGGALAKLLLPFRLGLGGPLGRGRQFMSWISRRDVVAAFMEAIGNPEYSGVYNLVSPRPVSNQEFTRALASALRRPAFLPVPELALKLVFGEMAKETILTSLKVLPQRLLAAGFTFQDPELEPALQSLVG
jgi:uncharacterized protein (TIGR01777 family)